MNLFDMKKLATLTLALFVFAGTAYGQESDSGTSTASVEVVSGLSVDGLQETLFGVISQGSTVSLDPTDGTTNNGSGATQAGKIKVEGATGQSFDISFSNTVTLNSGSNSLDLTVDLTANDADNAGGSSSVSSGDEFTLDSSAGDYFFFLGGDISVPNSQPTGTYTGDFMLTATYTSI